MYEHSQYTESSNVGDASHVCQYSYWKTKTGALPHETAVCNVVHILSTSAKVGYFYFLLPTLLPICLTRVILRKTSSRVESSSIVTRVESSLFHILTRVESSLFHFVKLLTRVESSLLTQLTRVESSHQK